MSAKRSSWDVCRCWVQPVTNPSLTKQIVSKHNYKRLKRTLFIRTKHNMRIFGEIVFTKQQQQQKGKKREKKKRKKKRKEKRAETTIKLVNNEM